MNVFAMTVEVPRLLITPLKLQLIKWLLLAQFPDTFTREELIQKKVEYKLFSPFSISNTRSKNII